MSSITKRGTVAPGGTGVPSSPQAFLELVTTDDIDEVLELARRSIPCKPLLWVTKSLEEHRHFLSTDYHDGRTLFKLSHRSSIIGVCGLHEYAWGPRSKCWASWFFVAPERRSTRAAHRLGLGLLAAAQSMGYETMYIETYSDSEEYSHISRILPRIGFRLDARLPDYFEPGIDALIYSMDLRNPPVPRRLLR